MLVVYLKRAGLVTGPISRNTSHSSLQRIKTALLGEPGFKGGEMFLRFGDAYHQLCLTSKKSFQSLTKEQVRSINHMSLRLAENIVFRHLMEGATCEEKKYIKVEGVLVAYILDINNKPSKKGADLKTTNVSNLKAFIEKAIKYGYFSQGALYVKAENLKEFYFIAQQKEKPYAVFALNIMAKEFKRELQYAQEEVKFLLYFFKHYGKTGSLEQHENEEKIKASKPSSRNKRAS